MEKYPVHRAAQGLRQTAAIDGLRARENHLRPDLAQLGGFARWHFRAGRRGLGQPIKSSVDLFECIEAAHLVFVEFGTVIKRSESKNSRLALPVRSSRQAKREHQRGLA